MKKSSIILTAILSLGMIAGTLGALQLSHIKGEKEVIQAKAEGEVNDTFLRIYNDSYNNVANGSTLNKTLFCFSGTAHGLENGTSLDDATTLGNIKLNGAALSAADGSMVYVWGGQNWFYIIYPKTTAAGSTLEILEGLTIGDSIVEGLKFTLNANGLWKRTFTDAVNTTYNKIYSDDFNNGTHATGYNRLMITYTGVAHNHSAAISNAEELKNYDNYILIDGTPLSAFAGAPTQIAPWNGQPWIQFIYPASAVSEGSVFTINEGCKIGDAVLEAISFTLVNSKWVYKFNDAVNARYSSIYSDDFNNGTHATGYNRLMFKYTGTAHGNPTAITTANELKKYDNYIQIDGNPLSAYAGGSTQIAPWNGQLWIQIIYPASAISEGSTLVISEGCKIGDAVFEKIVFKLNSSAKWVKLTLIDDDPLVKDGDYKLFTFGDYTFSANASYIRYAPSENIDALENSFGLRFIVNIPDGQSGNATAKIGCTNIYGSSPLMALTLDYTNNVYLTFNGSIDWGTNTVHAWSTGVDHLVEFYAIRTSETAVTCLLGIDGELIFKSGSKSLEGLEIHKFLTITGTSDSYTWYSDAIDTTAKALNRFNVNKLHANDVASSNNNDTGACRGNDGYYAKAKAFYNTFLTSNQMKEFATGASYADARARMVAWAAANGETLSFNASTGALVIAANYAPLAIITKNENLVAAIIALVFIGISTTFAVLWILRKRKLAK